MEPFFVCYSTFLLFLFLYNDPFLLLIEALSILELITMGPIPGLDFGSDAGTNNNLMFGKKDQPANGRGGCVTDSKDDSKWFRVQLPSS